MFKLTPKFLEIFFLYLLLNISISCNSPECKNQDILKSITEKVDKIEFVYYRTQDTVKSFITDKEKIKLLCNLIDGKVDSTIKQCKPSGNILYYSKDNIIFESFFTIGNGCEQLSYFISPQQYTTKLTYRAGMFLSENINSLK